MRRLLLPLALLAAPVMSAGCTAGIATFRMAEAARHVQEASAAGADARAPYEFQMAVRAMDKANEENAESEFKAAVQLAKSAATWADEAKLIAEGGSRRIDAQPDALPEGEDPLRGDPNDEGSGEDADAHRAEPPKPRPQDDEDDDFLGPEDDDFFRGERPQGVQP